MHAINYKVCITDAVKNNFKVKINSLNRTFAAATLSASDRLTDSASFSARGSMETDFRESVQSVKLVARILSSVLRADFVALLFDKSNHIKDGLFSRLLRTV